MFNLLVPKKLLAGFLFGLSLSAIAQGVEEELLTQSGEVVSEEIQTSSEHPQYDSQGNLVQETQQGEVVDYEVAVDEAEDEPER